MKTSYLNGAAFRRELWPKSCKSTGRKRATDNGAEHSKKEITMQKKTLVGKKAAATKALVVKGPAIRPKVSPTVSAPVTSCVTTKIHA